MSLSGRIFGAVGSFFGNGPGASRVRWYHDSEAMNLAGHHGRARRARSPLLAEARTYLAMYYNRPAITLSESEGSKIIGFDGVADLGFNVLAEAFRGGKAQIVQPLQARMTPVGGDWQRKNACEKLGQVIDGTMEVAAQGPFTDLAGSLVLDGALAGEGYGLVEVDPIKKDFSDCRLDLLESCFNWDRTEFMTLRAMTRRKAMAWFPEHKEAIWNAPRYIPEHIVEVDALGGWEHEDLVGIYQAWSAPMGNEAGRYLASIWGTRIVVTKDGKHEPWERPVPGYSFRWEHGHRENDSKPAARSVAPMHYWINEIVRMSYDTLAGNVPYVEGDKDPEWDDVPYKFIEKGMGATVHMPNLSGMQLNKQMIEDLRAQVMREVGMSEDAVHGSAPPQFKSGVALSNWREIVNKGLSQQHRAYEGIWTSSARIKVSWMPEVYSSKQAVAKAIGTGVIEQVDFSKINMPEDAYSLSWDVVSALPKSIPQKLELFAWLEEKGKIDADEVILNIQNPDVGSALRRITGPRALMDLQISKALNDEELIPPSRVQDNAKLAELAGQQYQAALAQHVKPPRGGMQKLLHLFLMAEALSKAAPGASGTQPAATPGGPGPGDLAAAMAPPAGLTPDGAPAMPEVPTPEMPLEPLPTS
jgi:hypothetical protein